MKMTTYPSTSCLRNWLRILQPLGKAREYQVPGGLATWVRRVMAAFAWNSSAGRGMQRQCGISRRWPLTPPSAKVFARSMPISASALVSRKVLRSLEIEKRRRWFQTKKPERRCQRNHRCQLNGTVAICCARWALRIQGGGEFEKRHGQFSGHDACMTDDSLKGPTRRPNETWESFNN